MVGIRALSAYRTFAFALLLALSFSVTSCWSVDAAGATNEHAKDDEHATGDTEDGKAKVSLKVRTKINLRLHNTYSKMEDLDQEPAFKQLLEQCFDSELPRIEALVSSSSKDYKLSHVRVRIVEQFWGDEYKVKSTSSSSSNERRLQEAAELQPLIVRLLVTGRYAERGPTFQLDDHKKLPSSADFYATIKSFFDGGGGDIVVAEYIPNLQEILPGNAAAYFMEIEEIELLEQNGIVIKDEPNKKNEVDDKLSRPGLIAGCVLLGIATICVLVMFAIRRSRRHHRFVHGEFILTRGPKEPEAVYLPSEIDLESVGGSIVSGMYYSSTGVDVMTNSEKGNKEINNLLPARSSEEDTDKDESFTIGDESSDEAESSNENHDISFLQLQPGGNATTTGTNRDGCIQYKDFSNTDIVAQAEARLMSYLAKYSDEPGEEQERKESVEEKSTISEASRTSADGSTTSSAASFASQEASLLKNLGVVGALAGEVEDDGKHEGSKGAGSVPSITNESKDIDNTSTEANLLKNLGVGPLLLPNEPGDEEKSIQSSPPTTNEDHVVEEDEDREEMSNETEHCSEVESVEE